MEREPYREVLPQGIRDQNVCFHEMFSYSRKRNHFLSLCGFSFIRYITFSCYTSAFSALLCSGLIGSVLTTTTQNQVCRADEVKNHDPSKRFLSLKQIPPVRKNRYKAVGRICVRHQDSIKTKQLKPFVVLPAGVRLKYLMSKVCFRFVFCDEFTRQSPLHNSAVGSGK